MIHTMQVAPDAERVLLQNLLAQRRVRGGMSIPQKQLILEQMKQLGSMEHSVKILGVMLVAISKRIEDIEKECSVENRPLRSLLCSLGVEVPLV